MLTYKKQIFTGIFLFFLFILPAVSFSQDVDARSPKPNSGTSQQVKADKKKEKQRKEAAKGIEKGKKRHEKLQAKNTKKMMKKSKKKSKRYNENKGEPFFKRLFTKKHH